MHWSSLVFAILALIWVVKGALGLSSRGRIALSDEERSAREAEGRRGAIRFRVPAGKVRWDDIVRGDVEIDTANIGGDFVIVRSDGTPLYHFAVVVDDAEMEITHIIRGEDHISNTPKHILLFRALGHAEPRFAHLPLILNADRTKMSKRKSQTAVSDYVAEGFIREALVAGLTEDTWDTRLPFWSHNRRVLREVQALEHKARRQDVLVDDALIYAFYDSQIPAGICTGRDLERWWREASPCCTRSGSTRRSTPSKRRPPPTPPARWRPGASP